MEKNSSKVDLMHHVEAPVAQGEIPEFRAGDTVRVHVRITEGDKERVQVFEGVVIKRHRCGMHETFTVRKVSYGVGVERIFPVESPAVTKLEIKSRGHVRRALDNGVTREEIGEIITHIAFYAGWPSAVNAARVAKEVFDED